MTGMKLSEGQHIVCFAVVPAGKVAWTYDDNEEGNTAQSGAVVVTVAGDADACQAQITALAR